MDPDLVRQQEEAERESRLAAAKAPDALSSPINFAVDPQIPTPQPFNKITSALPAHGERRSTFAIAAHFIMHCIAGAILGGTAGIAAAEFAGIENGAGAIMLGLAFVAAFICGAISLGRK